MITLGSHQKTYKVTVRSQITVEAEMEVQATSAGQARIIAGDTRPEDFNNMVWHVVGGSSDIRLANGLIQRVNVPDTPIEVGT